MTREPSIHITEANLSRIFDELGITCKGQPNTQRLVKAVLKKSKKYSLTNRKLLATNNQTAKKAEKISGADAESTMLMSQVIFQYRKSIKHKGVTIIKAGTPQYTILKTITKNVLEFYKEFEDHFTSTKDAAVTYIEIANGLMTNFNLTRIPSLHEKITNQFNAKLEIRTDPKPEYTNRAYAQYVRGVIEIAGTLIDDPKENPTDMSYFVQVTQRCLKLRITPEVYIQAQFAGLEFCNGIPSPAQLVSAKSLSYIQKHGGKIKAESPKVVDEARVNRLKSIISNG